jgi:nucleoside-diphosphate kinase
LRKPDVEQTLVILKPDCVQRRLVGRIIQRLEDKGLTIVAMKMMQLSKSLAERHYAPHKGKPFYPGLVDYVTSGPVVVMVVQGSQAIDVCRKLMGRTFGYEAEPGTIRGDFGLSKTYNLIHGSATSRSAPAATPRTTRTTMNTKSSCSRAKVSPRPLRGIGRSKPAT